MTQKQMLELVRQHHPEIGETQIRVWFNNALREFCRKTKILKTAYQFTTTLDTGLTTPERWYGLPPYIIDIIDVDFDGYDIPRLTGKPVKRDLT